MFIKCCIPLRIGCFILAYVNLICSTLETLAFGLLLVSFIQNDLFNHPGPYGDIKLSAMHLDEKPDEANIRLLFKIICCWVAYAVWLVMSVICLVRLHLSRPGLLRLYAACAISRMLLTIAGFIYPEMLSNGTVQIFVATHGIDLVLTAFFIIVYSSYALRLERESQQSE